MILAAGFGTRLRPISYSLPKPLLPVARRAVLDRMVERLAMAGCETVVVNCHHLAELVLDHVAQIEYPTRVHVVHEPEILGTGGGIKNAAPLLGDRPFVVANADVLSDVDFAALYDFHCSHPDPVTLVMHDEPRFNQVTVKDGLVTGFGQATPQAGGRLMAFTGIQVMDPEVLDYIPENRNYSSIDAYRGLLGDGGRIRAWVPKDLWWHDVGTPAGHSRAALEVNAAAVLGCEPRDVTVTPLAGDGSDRRWYRAEHGGRTVVAVDHGPGAGLESPSEANAFVLIGDHLRRKGLPVPEILRYDGTAGQAYVRDVGDTHLATRLAGMDTESRTRLYAEQLLPALAEMSILGAEGFDTCWCHQGPLYDRDLVLERECRYFIESFVNSHLGLPDDYGDFAAEFETLADRVTDTATIGFMHRDFQTRNIMVDQQGALWFIDYQAGRLGPMAYDLASLLMDPYSPLPYDTALDLARGHAARLSSRIGLDTGMFMENFRLCAVCRNMQILGAFAKLGGAMGKPGFLEHIPRAAHTLARNLEQAGDPPRLRALSRRILHAVNREGDGKRRHARVERRGGEC